MNRDRYRTVFCKRLGMLIAVAETARTQRKGSGRSRGSRARATRSAAASLVLAATGALWGGTAFASPPPLPTGGEVVSGAGTINQTGTTLTVNQSSQSLAANWQSFDIGANHSVVFNQPNSSSVALNRVIGPDASSIYGNLSANGNVFLINPNGVLFAPGAQVSVGGLVASTLSISDEDFAAGQYRFTDGSNAGSVVNEGSINAGSVALIGRKIVNDGTISTTGGRTTFAAGDQVTVSILDGLLTARVDASVAGAEIQNHGQIFADGGQVHLLAGRGDSVVDSLINTDGVIRANSIRNEGGKIFLDAGAGGTTNVNGVVDASGAEAGAHGGDVTVLGKHVALREAARIEASGDAGGGTVLVGGNWQGKGPEHNAEAVYVDQSAAIRANAVAHGDGGTVVLWSDRYTGFYGDIFARGGASGGNGGQVETSSHGNLQAMGSVDATSPAGKGGAWLLDPSDITISNSATSGGGFDSGTPTNVFTPGVGASTSTVNAADIVNSLNNGTSVTIQTNSTGGGSGDIDVTAAIVKSSGGDATLRLNADRNIRVGANITSSSNQLNIILDAHYSNDAASGLVLVQNATLNSNGGNITIGGGSSPETMPARGGNAGFVGSDPRIGAYIVGSTVNAAGGNIIINGEGLSSPPGGFPNGIATGGATIRTSGTGTIRMTGTAGVGGTPQLFFDGIQLADTDIFTEHGTLNLIGTGSDWSDSAGIRFREDGGGSNSIYSSTGAITLTATSLNTTRPPIYSIPAPPVYIGWDGGANVTTGNISIFAQTPSGSTAGANGLNLASNTFIRGNGGNLTIGSTGSGLSGVTLSSTLISAGSTWNNITIGDANTGPVVSNAALTASGNIDITSGLGTAADVTIGGHITHSGGDAALTIRADRDVLINSGINLISTMGEMDITLNSRAGDGATGVVSLNNGAGPAVTLNSNGGNITLGGGSNPATAPAIGRAGFMFGLGASIELSTVNAGGGNIIVNGQGAASNSGADWGFGISPSGSTITTTGAGSITMNGTGGSGSGLFQTGLYMGFNSPTISTDSGAISINGTGGSGGSNTQGILFRNGTSSIYSNSGPVTLRATTQVATQPAIGFALGGTVNVGWNGAGIATTGDVTILGATPANSTLGTNGLNLSGAAMRGNGGNLTIGSMGSGLSGISLPATLNAAGSNWNNVTIGDAASGILTSNGVTIAAAGAIGLTGSSYSFSNANSFTGNTFAFGNDNAIDNTGALTLNHAGNTTVGNAISGAGSLTKAGAGMLTLTGNNAYSGTTTIGTGTLQIGNGGTTGTLGTGNVIDNGTLAFNRSDAMTVSNAISGSGDLVQAGAGATTLTGNNTYAGTTTINAGTLQVGAGGTTGTLGTGNVVDNGTLTFNRSDALTVSNVISGSGDLVKTGAGATTLTGNNTYAGTTTIDAGTLQVGAGGTTGTLGTGDVVDNGTLTFNRSNALTVSNVISGSGNLVQAGGGGTTLTGANTYAGATAVNAGALAITNAAGLGATTGGTAVASGASLDLQNVAVGAENVSLAAGASLRTSAGTSSLSGGITLAGPGNSLFDVGAGAELTVSGVISGSGGMEKNNAGTLVLTAANTYAGVTQVNINAGTLAITNDSALGSTSGVTTVRLGGTLELRNVTVAENINSNAGGIRVSTGASTLTGNIGPFSSVPVNVLDGAQLTMSGVIFTAASVIKNGGGTLTLTGNNTSSGATTINAGTVRVGDGGTTGTLTRGSVTVASGANLVFDRSDSVSLSTLANGAGGITGAGNVTALIGGAFNVDRAIALSGANSSILLEAGRNVPAGTVAGGDVTLSSNVSTSATGTLTIFSGNATTAAYEAMVGGATGPTRYKTYGASAGDTVGAIAGTRNYYYRQQPAALTASGFTATKEYDGLLDASAALNSGAVTINGAIDGDTVALSDFTITGASFDNAHAGTRGLDVSFSGTYTGSGHWSIAGGGYTLANYSSATGGTITPKTISTSISPVGRTYDGLTGTSSTLNAPTGFVGNDDASGVSGLLLAFDNPNAGTRNISATGTGSLTDFTGGANGNGSGIGAGNEVAGVASDYVVATPTPVTAVIAQAPLTITANDDGKVLTQSDAVGYNGASYSGFVNGESSANLAGALSITRSNAGTEAAATYSGVLVPTGHTSGNYAITYVNGNFRILPAQQLLVSLQNVSSAYGAASNYLVTRAEYLDGNGTTLRTLTQTAQSGNTYTFSDGLGGSVTFTVAPTGAILSGAGHLAAGNYTLSGTNTNVTGSNFLGANYIGNQTVTRIGIAADASVGVSRVYDGTTSMTGVTLPLNGQLTGDRLLANGSGTFASRNAGSNLATTSAT